MSIRSELDTLVGAIRFFTRLNIPGPFGRDSLSLDRAIRYYPLVGLVVGSIAAVVFVITSFFWPKTLAVLAAIASVILVTGAIHEDGWCDMVDGFGGGWTKEKILEIMRDSRIGSFGATALVMLLLARFFTLIEIETALIPVTMIAGNSISRLCATGVLGALDYARLEGKAKAFDNRLGSCTLTVATLSGLLPLVALPLPQAIPAVLLAVVATLWLARMFRQQIGGFTGDCIGATQQLAEVAFYGGLLCRFG